MIQGMRPASFSMLVGNFGICKGKKAKSGYLTALYVLRNSFMPGAYERSKEIAEIESMINVAISDCEKQMEVGK